MAKSRVRQLLGNLTEPLTEILKEAVREVLAEALSTGKAPQGLAPPVTKPAETEGAPAAKKPRARRNIPKTCKVEGCEKPHKGPRYRFLCDEHREPPQPRKTKSAEQTDGGAAESTEPVPPPNGSAPAATLTF